MSETHRVSLIEAANQSGIPVEEIHSRVFRGDLPGDGNLAMPGNRTAGFVNAETFERLIADGRGRLVTGTVSPADGKRRHFYREAPIAQAAEDLGMTVSDLELLLASHELEGSFCFPRWISVKHESLAEFRVRQAAGAGTQNTVSTSPTVPVSRFRAVLQALTGGSQA